MSEYALGRQDDRSGLVFGRNLSKSGDRFEAGTVPCEDDSALLDIHWSNEILGNVTDMTDITDEVALDGD